VLSVLQKVNFHQNLIFMMIRWKNYERTWNFSLFIYKITYTVEIFGEIFGIFGEIFGIFGEIFGIYGEIFGIFGKIFGIYGAIFCIFGKIVKSYVSLLVSSLVWPSSAAFCVNWIVAQKIITILYKNGPSVSNFLLDNSMSDTHC